MCQAHRQWRSTIILLIKQVKIEECRRGGEEKHFIDNIKDEELFILICTTFFYTMNQSLYNRYAPNAHHTQVLA